MKYILISLFALLVLAGCGEKPTHEALNDQNKYNVDSSDIKAQPVANQNEAFKLEYKFEKGKTYHYRLTTVTNDIQTVTIDSTMKSDIRQTIIYLIDLTPVSTDKDGVAELNCTFKSVKLNALANGQEYNYESGTNTDSVSKSKYADYESLINSEIGIRVSRRGELMEVFRVDKILAKFLAIKGLTDSVNAQQRDQLRTNMVEGAVKPLLFQVFRNMPDHQLAVDSSWTFPQPATQFMVYQVQNTNTYKITGLEKYNGDKLAVIEGGIRSNITGKDKASDRGIDYTFTKPKTSAGGKIYFNITEGCLQKAKTFTNVDIHYTMEAKTPKGRQKGTRTESITNNYLLERL